MRYVVAAAALTLLPLFLHAQTAIYDAPTQRLTLPAVQVGTTTYSNVVIRLDGFEVLSVGPVIPPAAPPLPATCSSANFTLDKFNAILPGMTLAQVTSVIGCQYDSVSRGTTYTSFRWVAYPRNITVYFNVSPEVVQSSAYKYSSGF